MKKIGEKGNLDNFWQVWASFGKFEQVWTRQKIRKMGKIGRKEKKSEQKFER